MKKSIMSIVLALVLALGTNTVAEAETPATQPGYVASLPIVQFVWWYVINVSGTFILMINND